jgi:hypothetical protein
MQKMSHQIRKFRMKKLIIFNLTILTATIAYTQQSSDSGKIRRGNIGGYMITQIEKIDESFDAGYSMYAAAWPLVREYPGREFQSGLFGTWMHPKHDGPLPVEKLYTDIEGGLGWWRDTEYATATPKFIMGGVQRDFTGWANGPGAGRGRDWNNPKGQYGVAQLSPWILWPPDGLNLKQGTSGELFGSGYLPLPLMEPKSVTDGKNISTGNQCWTLFLNTGNFKGPVAFFTPYFWTKAAVDDPQVNGLFLDQRPSQATKAFQMETQFIHSYEATAANGQIFSRIAPTQYPVGPDGNSELLHRLMVYNKSALWDKVDAWFKEGATADGRIDLAGASMQKFKKTVRSNWKFYGDHIPKEKRALLNITSFMDTNVTDTATLRIRWSEPYSSAKKKSKGSVVTLPEYYKLVKTGNDDVGHWIAVAPKDVPKETGLHTVDFRNHEKRTPVAYLTPQEKESSWKTPGPAAGPFEAVLGDGSVVVYYWYRFADQPALLNADLTKEEREEMQRRVVLLHQHWKKDREYLPPPMIGKLADIDPALILTPPIGMEAGYVPIATQQGNRTDIKKLK